MIKTFQVDDRFEDRWDHYVAQHRAGNYCHLFRWKRIIKNTYGHSFVALSAIRSDCKQVNENRLVVGVLPIIRIKRYLFKDELVSMPFLDLGGVLADDPEIEQLLIGHALKLFKQKGAKNLELRQSEALTSLKNIVDNPGSHNASELQYGSIGFKDSLVDELNCQVMDQKVRMLLKLPESSDMLMRSFKSKLRSQIKKPTKEGLYCRSGGKKLLDDFYDIFCINMHELGSPVHSKRLMESILVEFSQQARIFVVYSGQQPLAASFTIGFNRLFSNPWASSLREYSSLAPNMLLYWSMLEYACDHQFNYFDFGRSTPNEGTYRFKAQWGAKPKPVHWYSFNNSDVKTTLTNNGKTRQFAEKVWNKLPLGLANWFGPQIRKQISL